MRKYIAFHGRENSGIQTRDKAIEWGTDLMYHKNLSKVHLCEVITVIERTTPPTILREYFPPTDESSLPKIKAADDF